MKAMILAAGRGERMRPLTDTTPKPLLEVNGKSLIQRNIDALHRAGVDQFVINTAWLGAQIRAAIGDGSASGVSVVYSDEGAHALETGGGVKKALPLLGDEPFWLVNGDVLCDYGFSKQQLSENTLAHLILIPNPEHNPDGDFGVADTKLIGNPGPGTETYTFAGISLLHPELIQGDGEFPLAPLLRDAADQGKVTAEVHRGLWMDIGTPERLKVAASVLR